MRRIPLRLPAAKSVLVFCALAASMLFFNFALPQKEPLSFAVFYAALACGRNLFASAAAYAIASAAFISLEGYSRSFNLGLKPISTASSTEMSMEMPLLWGI